MDQKTRELIAIGASISANCHPCLEYHLDKALEADCQSDEIELAINIGKLVSKGARHNTIKFSQSLMSGTEEKKPPTEKRCDC